MDGIPWPIAASIAGALASFVIWVGNKAWHVFEEHAERRTRGIEAIAPTIERQMAQVLHHLAEAEKRHEALLRTMEHDVVAALGHTRDAILSAIALEDRIEQLRGETTQRNIPAMSVEQAEATLRATPVGGAGESRASRHPRSRPTSP